MPRIDTYTENTSIEDNDKLLTYDPNSASTKLTTFSRIYSWIQSKLHALTPSTSAWAPSTDKCLVDRNGTLARIDYSLLAKAIVETYNGSSVAGSSQTLKSALDALNSNLTRLITPTVLAADDDVDNYYSQTGTYMINIGANAPQNYCIILVWKQGNYAFQLCIGTDLYFRKRSGSNPTWKPWYKADASQVTS